MVNDVETKTSILDPIWDEIQAKALAESAKYKNSLTKSKERIKSLGEVFTPTELVLEIIRQLPSEVWEPGKTYLDPTCGNGQFLLPAIMIKDMLGHDDYLTTVYGVDIMQDNIIDCISRILDYAGWTMANLRVLTKNLVVADGLVYNYEFNHPPNEMNVRLQTYIKALDPDAHYVNTPEGKKKLITKRFK